MSLDRGAVLNSYLKQKFIVKSYTEGKIVEAQNVLGVAVWRKYFIEYQVYMVDHNKFY